jgi:hypothetical protein
METWKRKLHVINKKLRRRRKRRIEGIKIGRKEGKR